ncbi:MAG: zinc-binding dehydrogenase [Candidatus Tectimicrobiota bacterium]
MKAAQLVGPKLFEFVEVEMPTIKDGECLVKLERVSICGSDIRHGYGPTYSPDHYPLGVGRPCHECAGTVVESRTDDFHAGQRVIVLPGAGLGGLAEYLPTNPKRMIALPDHGDLSEWVMCQPSGTVLYSCQRMGSVLGDSVLIMGQGAIGLSFTMLCATQGARQVIAVDLLDYRLQWAKEYGATHTINPKKENLAEAVKELTGGAGPDVTVEAAGYPETLDSAFRLVRQFGRVVIFGIQGGDIVPVDTRTWMDQQATIIPTTGARTPDPTTHIKNMVALKERGLVDPGRMVTHRLNFDVEDVNKAYQMYEQQLEDVIKVVMSIGS